MKKSPLPAIGFTALLLIMLVAASDGSVNGAKSALTTCAGIIIPCLFPFFVVSYLAGALGIPAYLGSKLRAPMALLFGTSGTGAGIFILGVLGGYPLGAAVIADHVKRGVLSANEGEKLLTFCNNSGPSFLIGAIGVGIFHSAAVGILLYAVHILSALMTGMFLSGSEAVSRESDPVFIAYANLSTALPDAISKSALQILCICGYVVFFGALTGALENAGVFSAIYGSIAAFTPLSLQYCRGLCMGLLELGCGIGAMAGTAVTPQALTVCSLLTGFGGLSVCMQTAGALTDTGIRLRYHILGRICCAGIGAFLTFTISSMLL